MLHWKLRASLLGDTQVHGFIDLAVQVVGGGVVFTNPSAFSRLRSPVVWPGVGQWFWDSESP